MSIHPSSNINAYQPPAMGTSKFAAIYTIHDIFNYKYAA